MTFEERLAELGVDLSDLPTALQYKNYGSRDKLLWRISDAEDTVEYWSSPQDSDEFYEMAFAYICHLTDIIDHMETRIVNLTGERDYLLRQYGFDCVECKRYGECRDNVYCELDIDENWAGVPEDWSVNE